MPLKKSLQRRHGLHQRPACIDVEERIATSLKNACGAKHALHQRPACVDIRIAIPLKGACSTGMAFVNALRALT